MKLTITDPPQWEDNEGISATWEEGGYRKFALPGRSDVITAQVIGAQIYLATERSAAHKALLVALQGKPVDA